MRGSICLAALAALALGAAQASAQSATATFESGTDEGFGTGFGNDASASFAIVNHGPPGNGTNYMRVPRASGAFQIAGHESSGADPFLAAMQAAANNEAGYALSYDYYIDTSLIGGVDPNTSFLQLGSYVNAGNGFYAQNFPGAGKEAELSGAQLASGQVFTGHVDVIMTAYGDMPTAQTFWRPGLIANGSASLTGVVIDYDNVSVHPIPEPASLALLGLAVPALAARRRRA